MAMLKREILRLIQLLQADNEGVVRCINPATLGNESGAGGLEVGVFEDALAQRRGRGTLDVDIVARGDEGAGGGWRERGSGEMLML